MIDIRSWVLQAERINEDDEYTYANLARDLVDGLGWTAAVELAAALRGHVYGQPGGHPLHQDVKPLYDRLGWQQSALVAAWFRDSRNWPSSNPPPRKRPGGWPIAHHRPPGVTRRPANPENQEVP